MASPAAAQLPDTCVQYPDDPECENPNPPPNRDPEPRGLENEGGTGTANASDLGDGNGDLPFTGYPVSSLILFALLLLLLGLLVRATLAIGRHARERFAGTEPPGS